MSWAVTVDNVQEYEEFSPSFLAEWGRAHPMYPSDMALALAIAKAAGFASASLSGGRTPGIYNDNEIVDISVRGMTTAQSFNPEIQRLIDKGPDVPGND